MPGLLQDAATDREKAKAAQQARAKKYHIAVKDGGNVTKPGEWKDLPDSAFGDPVNYRYPMADKAHADNAAARWGDPENRTQYSSAEQKIIGDRILARQKHFGTKAAQDDKKESTSVLSGESVSLVSGSGPSSSTATRPRSRIATIQVCWIEDNARSLNGRIYPKEAVDRLIASAIRKLADPNSLPITCFLSHADADEDRTPALIGRVTRVWREGTRGMATIDLADTAASRDALALISGGYLCTESLRARGAELRTDKHYDVPVVGGDNLELEGIDLTNYPGLEQVARIQQIHLAESTESAERHESLTEVFALTPSAVQITLKELGMPKKLSPLTEAMLREEGILPRTSGDSPSMTDDNPSGAYQQKNYPVPDLVDPADLPAATSKQLMESMKRTHDHLANVLDATLTPIHSKESLAPLAKPLSEAGRKLARKHATALMAAHDEAASQCGLNCAGGYHDALGMGQDGDGDDDDYDESRVRPDGEQNPQMTPGFANQAAPGVPAVTKKKGQPFQPATALPVGADGMEMSPKERKRLLKEAVRVLESEGYDVHLDRKKSREELLEEQIAALKEAQEKELKEIKEMLLASQNRASAPAPQRRSQVVGANIGAPLVGGQPMHGRHLQEQIKALDWQALADRTAPLPDSIPLELLIKEFEQFYAVLYDGKYGILTAANQ
jgi:hypothetical protein